MRLRRILEAALFTQGRSPPWLFLEGILSETDNATLESTFVLIYSRLCMNFEPFHKAPTRFHGGHMSDVTAAEAAAAGLGFFFFPVAMSARHTLVTCGGAALGVGSARRLWRPLWWGLARG